MSILTANPESSCKWPTTSVIFWITACLLLLAVRVDAQIGFTVQDIDFVSNPTAMEFGPDGRLYVSELDGTIFAYTIERDPDTQTYTAVDTEVIDLIHSLPNHNDDGSPHDQTGRNVTGLTTAGTAEAPLVYVSSSDPRIDDTDADTNSGVISRLYRDSGTWQRHDLVRGLPRSAHDHFSNGLVLDEATETLYVAQGGHTNMGAPSINFGLLPEYALSAAILAIDLATIGETTYDLPTLAGTAPPFGGQGGANQALLVPNGPVQVHAPGVRNPYDILKTASGHLYTVDNGPNSGWGDMPAGEGFDDCLNSIQEGGFDAADGLHLITGAGYYGGHPNPTRANPANTFDGASPVPTGNPVECDYRIPGTESGALMLFPASTNGLAEYTASNFDGAMQGNVLATSWNGSVTRVTLNDNGDAVIDSDTLFTSLPGPLGITAQGDEGPFPGTIWIGQFFTGAVTVFEPIDFSGCDPALLDPNDTSSNGFTFGDLIDNGLDPCNPAQVPPDFDGDFTSDLNDPDIDDDGVANSDDVFDFDPTNGLANALPFRLDWSGSTIGTLGGMSSYSAPGFTGLMADPAGTQTVFDQFDAGDLIPGGAAGVFTVQNVTAGDARSNSQDNGFHIGVNTGTQTGPLTLRARLASPFAGTVPDDPQSFGITIGNGDQDHYIRLAVHGNAGAGGIELSAEPAAPGGDVVVGAPVLGAEYVDLYLEIDPLAGTVTASYAIGAAGQAGPRTPVDAAPVPIPSEWLQSPDRGLAVGIISTAGGAGTFPAGWKFIEVYPGTGDNPEAPSPTLTDAAATLAITAGTDVIDVSTFGSYSFQVTNDASGGERINELRLSLPGALISEAVFDPDGTAGDTTAKPFALDNEGGTGFTGAALSDFHNSIDDSDGFDTLTLTFDGFDPGETMAFSIDVDPNSIKGSGPPGPNESGSVSGLELTGAEVVFRFDDGAELAADVFGDGSLGGGVARAVSAPAGAPVLEILGIPSPGVSNEPTVTARIIGLPGAEVTLLRVLGGLFVDPSGPFPSGYDVGAHDINSVVEVEWINPVTLDGTGTAIVPITLTRQESPLAMQNRFVAVQHDAVGLPGRTSKIIKVDYDPDAVLAPALIANPDPVAFGQLDVGTTASNTVTLSHGGTSDDPAIQVESIVIVGDPDFTIAPTDPFILQPGESRALEVSFSPTVAGSFGATLDIVHDGQDGWLSVAISGSAVEPLPAGPAVLRLNAGLDAPTTVGGVTWEGDAAWLMPDSVGSVFSVSDMAIAGTLDDELYQSERYGNPFGYEIPVTDGTYRVRLHFAEIWHGVFTTALEPGDRVFDIVLEGEPRVTGLDLAVAVGAPLTAHIIELDVVVDDGVLDVGLELGAGGADQAKLSALEVLTVDSDPPPPPPPQPGTVTAAPDALDFGSVVLGETATRAVVLANPGEEPVTISGLGVDDPQGEFTLQAPPALPLALAAGAEVTLTLAFAPIDEGTADGLLTVTHDGANGPLEVLLEGLGEAAPPPPQPGTVTATPDMLILGSVIVGETATTTVVLANPGEEPVTISALDVDDPQGEFALQAPPALPLALAAGAEVTLTLAFTPIDAGIAGGLLTVTHDGANGPLEVLLDGLGETAPLPVGPAVLRLNAGLDASTTVGGVEWQGDAAWLVPGSAANVFAVPGEPIAGTLDDALYQSERYGNPFGYEIPVADGSYRVRLHFAEIWHGVFTAGLEPGNRVFDILLEDQPRVTGLDLAVAVGAPLTAHIIELDVVVDDGVLDVGLELGAGGVDQAKLSALEVIALP